MGEPLFGIVDVTMSRVFHLLLFSWLAYILCLFAPNYASKRYQSVNGTLFVNICRSHLRLLPVL